MLKVMHVVGARPNFPKIAPIMAEMGKYPNLFCQVLVHTGQHYDYNMSQIFFENLEMPLPDEYLNIGSDSHAAQTAQIMTKFEPVVLKGKPDWVIVAGDVNSTLACTLVCSKLGTPVAHIEAGLRSNDRSMPEEINRLVTDRLSDLLFTPSRDASENLLREGTPPEKIHFVGNVMIDTLVKMLPAAQKRSALAKFGLTSNSYVLATLHRPANVDNPSVLMEIMAALGELSRTMPALFPVHPRTQRRIRSAKCLRYPNVIMVSPLGYIDFLVLMKNAALVLTDSGGIQEETTFLRVPCLTIRPNTERPITVQRGTNRLANPVCSEIVSAAGKARETDYSQLAQPELWDGNAAQRIVALLGGGKASVALAQ
jgi:UDP-N-acetylglucosamine 2-epimerase (non-hydrolysing)